MRRWFGPACLWVLLLAGALRLPQLNLRVLHNDEAVNAIKFRSLWVDNKYVYDPNEFHGPVLPYFTIPAAVASGAHDFADIPISAYRATDVIFGFGCILLIFFLTNDLGRGAAVWSALFMALSPAMVFYSRYYIHEMPLAFFTALAGVGLWRHRYSERLTWCLLAGISLGLMWATKETFVFALVAMAVASVAERRLTRRYAEPARKWDLKHAAIALAAGLIIAIAFFASFGANPHGVIDAIQTYAPWLHRAEGSSPHVHPWYFYLQHLFWFHPAPAEIWSEGAIGLLAIVGGVVGFREGKLQRLILFYTVTLTLIYSFLPYKTTWCLLSFYYGWILLAGIGAAWLGRASQPLMRRVGIALLLGAACLHLVFQSVKLNLGDDKSGVPLCDSIHNPYVYSQTSPDVFRLLNTVEGIAQASPQRYDTTVEVMSVDSYWPLPWYLRRFTHVGYWDKIPDQPPAPIMIVATALNAGFDERPQRSHLMAGYFQLRPGVFYELYVSVDLWSQYIKTLPPEKD